MYADIYLLSGMPYKLTYKVPLHLEKIIDAGSIVLVPLQNKIVWGLVDSLQGNQPAHFSLEKIKTIQDIYELEDTYQKFIHHLAEHHATYASILYKNLLTLLRHKTKMDLVKNTFEKTLSSDKCGLPLLNDEQQKVIDEVCSGSPSKPFLLHGITGSGKTAVYAHLITHAYLNNQSSIVLAPEITLAQSLTHMLKKLVPASVPLIELHSGLTQSQKTHALAMIMNKVPAVFIGVHIPIMLPITSLGMCIIDEEHDSGYQEKSPPFIHSKDAAILRSHYQKIPLVLGSATPSITSLYFAKQEKYALLKLTHRYFDTKKTKILHTKISSQSKHDQPWISKELKELLTETLERNEQSLLFINRKGTHCYAECGSCKKTLGCSQCSVPYTVHHYHMLKCHHCFTTTHIKTECPYCKCANHTLVRKGVGIEHIHHIVEKLFPHARIERADLDSIADKKRWHTVVERMNTHEIDILIGTHAIIKGYHFPRVTLAAALWADMHIHLPHYLACEQTIQQLIQMTGRVGRDGLQGTALIQTMHDHESMRYIDEAHYEDFYNYEINFRKNLSYPPFLKCGLLVIKNKSESVVKHDADMLFESLSKNNSENDIHLLGPAPAPIYKIKNIYTMVIMLKAKTYSIISHAVKSYVLASRSSTIHYIPNPLSIPK